MRNSRLSGSSGSAFREEDANPMESIANIVDVMLVFACGLLLALVTVWNVDIGLDVPDIYEVNEVIEQVENDIDKGDLVEAGTVYKDPETGALYFVEENNE